MLKNSKFIFFFFLTLIRTQIFTYHIISYLCSVFVYCLKKEYISETCYSEKSVLIMILLQLLCIAVTELHTGDKLQDGWDITEQRTCGGNQSQDIMPPAPRSVLPQLATGTGDYMR